MLFHHRSRRYLAQLAIVWILAILTKTIIGFHQIPPTRGAHLVLSWVVPFFVVLAGIVLAELPVGVVAFYEEVARLRDMRVDRELGRVLLEAQAESSAIPFMADEVIPIFLRAITGSDGPVYLITPNALYVLADKWRDLYPSHIEDPAMLHLLMSIGKEASEFRECLINMNRPIHWIMPDLGFDVIRTYLELRAELLGITSELVRRVNKEAVRWVQGELAKTRSVRGQKTLFHHMRCLPGYRLLMTSEACFFQNFPRDSCGLKEPIYMISKRQQPGSFLAIQLAVSVWCDGPGI